MQALSAVGLVVFWIATTSIGVRLLRLWRKTRLVPELTIGMSYFASGTLGWTLVLVGASPAFRFTPVGLALRTIGVFCMSLGSLALGVGTWRVFRPERRAVAVPLAMLAAALIADFVRNALLRGTPFVRADDAWYWPGAIGRSLPIWWSTYETFRYHALLRRRLRLGLIEPVVVNKLFLWGVSGACGTAMAILAIAGTVFDFDYRYAQTNLMIYGVLGAIGAAAIWLAFFPPERYVKYVALRGGEQGG
jgi:hypothetical protein